MSGVKRMIGEHPEGDSSCRPVSGLAYGHYLKGELPRDFEALLFPVADSRSEPERTLELDYRVIDELPQVKELWSSEPRPPETRSRLALFRTPRGFGLSVACAGSGLFLISGSRIEIRWLEQGGSAAPYFFSYALPLWLEWRGMPVLHASVVSIGDRAVGFIGPSGVGKSTLCAGLLRSGFDFVADDGLVLHLDGEGNWRCLHGPPLLRLWPSALEGTLGVSALSLPRVYPSLEKRMLRCQGTGTAMMEEGPRLAALYLIDRHTEESQRITMTPCTARESLVRLVEHSLAAAPAAAMGLSAKRLETLSRVVEFARLKRLRFPGGRGRWHLVREAILEDLAR